MKRSTERGIVMLWLLAGIWLLINGSLVGPYDLRASGLALLLTLFWLYKANLGPFRPTSLPPPPGPPMKYARAVDFERPN